MHASGGRVTRLGQGVPGGIGGGIGEGGPAGQQGCRSGQSGGRRCAGRRGGRGDGFGGQVGRVGGTESRQRQSQRPPARQVHRIQRDRVGLQTRQRGPVPVGQRAGELGPGCDHHRRGDQRPGIADDLLAGRALQPGRRNRTRRDPQRRAPTQFGRPGAGEAVDDGIRIANGDSHIHALVAHRGGLGVVNLGESFDVGRD